MRQQRTKNLAYEPVGGYERPRKLPPVLSEAAYRAQLTSRSEALGRLFDHSGLGAFIRRVAKDEPYLDALMRTEDIRWNPFSFLTLSATALLRDSPEVTDPLVRAARLIVAARTFYEDLREGRLRADTFRQDPLEMGQYMNLFATGISPGGTASRIYKSAEDTYIIVMLDGACYRVDLFENDKIPSVAQVRDALHRIVEESRHRSPRREDAIGALTCLSMPERIAINKTLSVSRINREAFDIMSNAFFVVCLDLDTHPESDQTSCRLVHSGRYWNRWYYTSFQMVIFGNAKAGLIFSFPCGLDGNVMARFSQEVCQRSERLNDSGHPQDGLDVRFCHIPWQIPRSLLRIAEMETQKIVRDDRDLFTLSVGKNQLAKAGLRPDALFNLALLLAIRRLTGDTVTILEHATMSRFRNMGLTLARVTTPEAVRLTDLMMSSTAAVREVLEALKAASEAHATAIRNTRNHLPLRTLALLHFRTAPLRQKPLAFLLSAMLAGRPPVVVSNPRTVPEVVALGRPGVRLTCVRYIAMHYAIGDERIQVLFMPVPQPRFSNDALASRLESCLKEMVTVIEDAGIEPIDETGASRKT